jgi:hypothetical protein
MSRANCEAVYLGVEALDEESLLYLGKTAHPQSYLTVLQEQVVPQLMFSNIDCYINLQLGIPGGTKESRWRTLARLSKLGRVAQSHGKEITVFPQLHVVYPATAHFRDGVSRGRFPDDIFESFTEWEYKETPVRVFLGREFAHGTGGIPEGILVTENLQAGRDFRIDGQAVIDVINQLEEMEEIPGIRVFKYGQYLVNEHLVNERDEAEALDGLGINEINWAADSRSILPSLEARTKRS